MTRTDTGQAHATYGVVGEQQDVTQAATWSISDANVATVDRGQVRGVGLGSATLTVQYQGQSKTLTVTVCRRMALMGSITLNDAGGNESLVAIRSFVDGHNVGYHSVSHANSSLTVTWDRATWIEMPVVHPGARTVSVDAAEQVGPDPKPYVSTDGSQVEVIDADTYQLLSVIKLPVQQRTLAPLHTDGDHFMTWSIEVPAFSS